MTIPAASPTSAAYRDALLALQKQQRAQLTTLIQQTEAALHEDWLRGPGIVSQYYAPLIDQYARALNDLRALNDDPAAKLSLDWLTSQNQSLRQIEANVRYTLDKYATEGVDAVTAAQRAAANAGLTDASALTQEALSPAWEKGVNPAMLFSRPNPDAIAAWVGRAGNGHPLGDLFSNFSSEATSAARQAMLLGLATGANPLQMVSGIQQAMGISRSRAITIARTEVLGSYRAAAHMTYRQNSDVLNYWLWSAGGANPCAMCMGMDGTLHGLEESLDDHPCGKCAPLPVTKPWSDILGPLGIDASDLEETSIGAPGAYETGEEKFARMSPERQREIIGTQTGYEAYQRGEVSLKDFIGVRPPSDGFPSSYYQRSLKELQIPTRQGHLVEPSQLIAGPHRAIQRGAVTPDELMPAWAKQSAASRNVYQILRNGLPYDMMSHEQGLLITNLEQMLREDIPVNVRAAVERQLQALGQSVERQTAGAAARDVAEREIGRAFAPARATISEEEAAARAEVKTARSQVNSLNRKLNKALEAGKSTEQLEKDIQAARATLEKAQGRLDTQVAIRKAQEAAAKQAAKEAKAAERLAAREAAKAQKAAEREAAKAAKRAEKQAAKEATTQAAREAEQEIEHAAITDTGNFSTDLGTAEDIQKAAESNSFFGDAKHQYYEWKPIVSRLGARLADNPDVQALADRIKEIAKAEGSRFTASPRNAVDFILSQYHTTFAYEENPFVIELQKAVQEEFGTAGRAYGNFSARSIAQADKLLGDVRPGLRAIVREMYNDTQQYFEEQGITEVNLYRGMSFSTKTKPEGLLFNGAAQQAQMELHAMSSFSVNPTEAASYAEGVGKDRYVVVAGTKVPVERILSIPQTGFGSFRDHEVLVLGGTDNYVVIPKVVGANAVETVPYTPEELYAKFGVAQTLATSEANDAAFAASRAMQGPFSAGASYDLSAADKAFVENVRQQISALDQAGMSHEEVRAIGQQINDRIMSDPVIADLHDAAVAVQTIRSSEFSQLTEDQLAWVRGDASAVEAHGGVKFNDAYVRYQAEYQARVKTYLQEVREMGGADVRLAEDADAVGSQAIRDMQDVMPRDWIEASNDLGDVQIVKNGARNSAGWYEASQDGGGKIGLSYNRATPADDLALRSNALHEMMHRMENAIPRIGDLERDFYNSRTLGEEYVRLTNGIAQRTKLDEWIDEYLGREPIVSLRPEYTTALGNVARTSASYELLSMGAEMLLGGGGTYDLVALREDQEFVHFILGLLSIVRAEGAGAVLP